MPYIHRNSTREQQLSRVRSCEFDLLRLLGFLLFLKNYFCVSAFSYANPLPPRSMESKRDVTGTGYGASLHSSY